MYIEIRIRNTPLQYDTTVNTERGCFNMIPENSAMDVITVDMSQSKHVLYNKS